MEFLHRVPDCTTLIFGIGSMSPAALLYDARDHYDRQSAKVLFLIHGTFVALFLIWINCE